MNQKEKLLSPRQKLITSFENSSERQSPQFQISYVKSGMPSKRSLDNLLNDSQMIKSEKQRSEIIKQKHQKEINHLLNYENLIKKQRLEHEAKLMNLFERQQSCEEIKKLKSDWLTQIKVKKGEEILKNIKLKQEKMKHENLAFYKSQQQQLNIEEKIQEELQLQQRIREKEKILKNDQFKLKRSELLEHLRSEQDLKKAQFDINDELRWKEIQSFKENKIHHLIEQHKNKNEKLSFILQKYKTNEQEQLKEKDMKASQIEAKILKAKIQKQEQLDLSVQKIKEHDLVIDRVLNNNKQFQEDTFNYYQNKINSLEDKINQIRHKKQMMQLSVQENEQIKEYYRKQVKLNSEMLQKLKTEELQKNQSYISIRKCVKTKLRDQKRDLAKVRSRMLEQLQDERKSLQRALENERYPLLNSIDFEDQLKQKG